jgi:AraC-like DNA-binding protein
MGYRNFSSFLNHYRIAAVKEAMQQPDNARTPILTLAMDVGFNSIATFNRAFLNESGVTPSEYRSKLLDDTDQN